MTISEGDRLLVIVDVPLAGGGCLKSGQRGVAFDTEDASGWFGFSWTDAEGNHSMALGAEKVRQLPNPGEQHDG